MDIYEVIDQAKQIATNLKLHIRFMTVRDRHTNCCYVNGQVSIKHNLICVPVQVFNTDTWSKHNKRVIISQDAMTVKNIIDDGFLKAGDWLNK